MSFEIFVLIYPNLVSATRICAGQADEAMQCRSGATPVCTSLLLDLLRLRSPSTTACSTGCYIAFGRRPRRAFGIGDPAHGRKKKIDGNAECTWSLERAI